MTILCHVGHWRGEQYRAIAHAIGPSSDLILASGFMEINQSCLDKKFHQKLGDGVVVDKEKDFDTFIQSRIPSKTWEYSRMRWVRAGGVLLRGIYFRYFDIFFVMASLKIIFIHGLHDRFIGIQACMQKSMKSDELGVIRCI